MKKIIASLYPSPFDEQIRHELNASIFYKGKIYSYEEAKITSVKNDGTTLFPERSLFLGFKELGILPKNVDLWVLPKPSKIDVSKLYLFFSFIKAFNGPRKKFDNWFKKKILFIRHQDLHAHQAIGGSGFKKGVYYNIDGGGDFGENRIIPDIYRTIQSGKPLELRMPNAIRPWQHVLDCLSGYLHALSFIASSKKSISMNFNVGPQDTEKFTVLEICQRAQKWFPSLSYNINSQVVAETKV